MVIVEYNPAWKQDFETLKGQLSQGFPFFTRIEHTGSTAIPGMSAKPVIDLIAVIKDDEDFEAVKEALAKLGYQHNGDQGIEGREAFGHEKALAHHLYVCRESSAELGRHVLFRDYLKAHEKARNEYNKIKHDILDQVGWDNRPAYVELKATQHNEFFERILKEAAIWSSNSSK